MKTAKMISVAEFKQKCLALMTDIALHGTELVITKRGGHFCKVIPIEKTKLKKRFGWLKGIVKIQSELTQPVETAWEAINMYKFESNLTRHVRIYQNRDR